MSSYAQEVARRREAAIRREPVTGQQMGLGGLLHGLARTGVLATAGGSGLGYFDAVASRLGGGAALNPYQYPPMPIGMARPLGGRYAPRTPGLRAETLDRGDDLVSFEGKLEKADVGGSRRAYNLRNEADEIVASADRQTYPGSVAGRKGHAYVPGMWVREDYRKTPAMFDLYNLLSRGGKTPLHASFANPRLRKVFEKRMGRKHADAVRKQLSEAPLPSLPEGGFMENAARNRQFASEMANRVDAPAQRQLTNRDVPSVRQMAPVRRQPTPRPAPSPLAGRIALEARAREQERALLDARRAEYLKDVEKMVAQSRREAVIRRGGR